MSSSRPLPPEFLAHLEWLAKAYCATEGDCEGSGFGGGRARWEEERSGLARCIHRSGSFLDVGCANGLLLDCLPSWCRPLQIDLFGLDASRELIERAQARLSTQAQLFVGNAWDWQPPQRFDFVYSLYDCVPEDYLAEYVERLLESYVACPGRLILGAYGSRSRSLPPFPIAQFLEQHGYDLAAVIESGENGINQFAAIDRPHNESEPRSE